MANPNRVTDHDGTIGGGVGNQAGDDAGTLDDACCATVGGGVDNKAKGGGSTIGGGGHNVAPGPGWTAATIAGGYENRANDWVDTVGGGQNNTASGSMSTVSGGERNTTSSWGATVGGGKQNTAGPGMMETVPGGMFNVASGGLSFAAGYRAKAIDGGSFVWGDWTEADVTSAGWNSFVVRASGGAFFSNNLTVGGTVSAPAFSGDGSGLTGLPRLVGGNSFFDHQSITGNLNLSGSVSGVTGNFDSPAGVSTVALTVTQHTDGAESKGIAASTYSTVDMSAGVYGHAEGASGRTFGVWGETVSPNGVGVMGQADSHTGNATGVKGYTWALAGVGVDGAAAETATEGVGVEGYAAATSGFTIGVRGSVLSPDGTAGVFINNATPTPGKILSGMGGGTEVFRVDGSGNVYASGSVAATSFVGPLSGIAADLECSGCVSPTEVDFNYAASASQGGDASNALLLNGFASSAFQPAGTYATLGSNTFTTTQSISSGDLSVSSGNISLPQTASASAGVINLGGSPLIHACCSASQENTFVGSNAGNFTTTGNCNSASGYYALSSNTTGTANTANGYGALYSNAGGNQNTASGKSALAKNTTGNQNTGSGWSALFWNTTGNRNSAGGAGALSANTTGSYNTASGYSALSYNCENVVGECTGNYNTALGYQAGVTGNSANSNVTGGNNTFLGALSGPGTSTQLSNATAIGYNALVSASNALVLGGTGENAVNVGIGTQTPTARFEVVDGDVYASTAGKGVIVKSPDGTKCARIGIDDSGALSVTALTCP